jgi:hypothetical protein
MILLLQERVSGPLPVVPAAARLGSAPLGGLF